MLEQRGADYGAMIIKGSAGIVITVSLALIFLVVGNMVYQTFTNRVVFREKVPLLMTAFAEGLSGRCILKPQAFFIKRRIRAVLFPCFLRNNNSTADEGEDSVEEPGVNNSLGIISAGGISFQQNLQVPSNYRSRFLFASDVAIEQPEPGAVGRPFFPQGIVPKDEPYVVHTSVHYMNCLVPRLDLIVGSSYYWGVMDRYEAEALLDNRPEGTFLLRDSAQSDYLFSVSFRRYKRTLHARIEQKNHRFSFDFSDTSIYSAATITELIAYYKDPSRCLFFEPQLSVPLPRNFVFPLQHLCRAQIASLTNYDGVEKLNLPVLLKRFIKEYHYKHPVKTVNHIPQTDHLHVGTSSSVAVTTPADTTSRNAI